MREAIRETRPSSKYQTLGAYHWVDLEKSTLADLYRFSLPLWTRYSKVLEVVPRDAQKIVEIGCGDGALTYLLWKKARCSVAGFDIDATGIGLAKERIGRLPGKERITFLCKDFSESGFSERSADVVVLADVIEHIPNPRALLEKCRQIMSPNGVLIMTTPIRKESGLWDKYHVTEYTAETLQEMLSPLFAKTTIGEFMTYGFYRLYAASKAMRFLCNMLSIVGLNLLSMNVPWTKRCMLLSVSRLH